MQGMVEGIEERRSWENMAEEFNSMHEGRGMLRVAKQLDQGRCTSRHWWQLHSALTERNRSAGILHP